MNFTEFSQQMYQLEEEYDSIEIIFSDPLGTVVSVDLEGLDPNSDRGVYQVEVTNENPETKFVHCKRFTSVINTFWTLINDSGHEWSFLF